jgi:ADP-ribosyl-[dinitrogen reductase] hydrolase
MQKMNLSTADRLAGAVWGHLVGDAMGVPYEFTSADEIKSVEWGHKGTHGQPPGTWSDDGGLMLALLDSLLERGFDLQDQGQRALRWAKKSAYMPGGVFDMGITTSQALRRIEEGIPAHESGMSGERHNGNGSLMRILPIALVYRDEPVEVIVERAMAASALTHAHPRAKVACAVYCLIARGLLTGESPEVALRSALSAAHKVLGAAHLSELSLLEGFSERDGSGYVLDTFWCAWDAFAGSGSYGETISRAIRYGNDTDTTAAVAGGLAGIYWGTEGMPREWLGRMRGKDIAEPLIRRLCATVSSVETEKGQRLGAIPAAFESYFHDPKVHFPEKAKNAGGIIAEGGWSIRYLLGRENSRTFMELYAINRRTSDRHLRIFEDGTVETLPIVSQGYTYKPDVSGDEERAKQEQESKDQPIISDLRRKGLL